MTKHVRFAWWTDEEQGLNGSDVLRQLAHHRPAGLHQGRTTTSTWSARPTAATSSTGSPPTTAAPLKAYWDSLNMQPEENVEGQGRSDDYSFQQAGIPTSRLRRRAPAPARPRPRPPSGAARPARRTTPATTGPATPPQHQRHGAEPQRRRRRVRHLAARRRHGTPTNDFSVAVSPTSGRCRGRVDHGDGHHGHHRGTAQTVGLSASGAPAGSPCRSARRRSPPAAPRP